MNLPTRLVALRKINQAAHQLSDDDLDAFAWAIERRTKTEQPRPDRKGGIEVGTAIELATVLLYRLLAAVRGLLKHGDEAAVSPRGVVVERAAKR